MFIGQSGGGRKGGGPGMAQREQKAVLAEFRAGGFNALVATCIGEEGLDIPQVGEGESAPGGPQGMLQARPGWGTRRWWQLTGLYWSGGRVQLKRCNPHTKLF